jgi:hypothetical protein
MQIANKDTETLARKLSRACYLIRSAKTYTPSSSLKIIYYAFFHSLTTYGFIFWGNFPHSITVFRLQKKAVPIMEECGNRVSCRDLFQKLHILRLISKYVLSLLMCVVQRKDLSTTNIESHNLETRQSKNLYAPQANLSTFQKGASYSWIKFSRNYPLILRLIVNW